MARPKTKDELLTQGELNYQKLISMIDALSTEEIARQFPTGMLNRNIRDVLAHLHHWHLMFLNWYEVGMRGDKPEMPAAGYTWRSVPDLNREIQSRYSDTPLKKARALLDTSHKRLRKLIEKHTDEELFEKKRYPWTGSTSLGAYLVSSTSSHYDWALKLIRKALR